MAKLALPKLVYTILLSLIALGLTGIYFQYLRTRKTQTQNTASASAAINKVDVVRTADPETGGEHTAYVIVNYSVSINNSEYSRSEKMSSGTGAQFVPWRAATVCYDPLASDPLVSAELHPPGFACGK